MTLLYDAYASTIISFYGLKPSGGEYCGPCPNCGGEDRFRLQKFKSELRHHCRKECPLEERTAAMRRDGVIPQYQIDGAIPYHVRKDLALIGAELTGSDILVPLFDIITNKKVGAQTITPDGRKFFSKGMKKAGVGALIGAHTDRIYVTEGWADAVVVHQATGSQALFALDAKSMPKAVASLKKRHPHSEIIVVADHDDEGLQAAKATGVPYCRPAEHGMDVWDLWKAGGNSAVIAMLNTTITDTTEGQDKPLASYGVVAGDQLSAMEFPPVEFLLPELLPTPTLALLVGPPKAGKSWLAWRWALAVSASGRDVFFIASEDSQRRIKERIAAIHGAIPSNMRLLAAHDSPEPIPRGQEAVKLIRSVKEQYPDTSLIVIDVAQAIMEVSTREKGYSAASAEWGTLQHLAHELKIAILLVHHAKKTSGLDLNSPLESVLGSTAIAATAETVMIMEPIAGSRDVKLHITGKDVDTLDLAFPWKNPGFGNSMDADEVGLGETQMAVLDYIRLNPKCTLSDVTENLNKDKGQVSKIIARLVSLGKVSKNERHFLFPA
ncbi:AAA family ATPase [Roseovarius sp. 10]|uniref:AAA family ATPase n=1 Tax=Roseovarius sp. 10 TaxID=3080563 RepID=UPI002954FF0C|nr:AAA family ATPase [Roseovarius sp. 10]MDV7201482.1 AAA family ATPase [Roseovarius sp. 10]